MDPQLKSQCKAVVGVATGVTVDFSGQTQVGSAATYYCRIEPRYREVHRNGVIEKTTHMLILTEDFEVSEAQSRDMLIWLPNVSLATISDARRALSVAPCYDENNTLSHWEILV